MLCPLRTPFQKTSSQTNCTSTKSKMKPFGVLLEHGAKRIPEIKGTFWDEFTIIKRIKKSKKLASFAFAVHNSTNIPVMVKSFVEYDNVTDYNLQNLLYEVKMYQAMQELASVVPHFATFVAFFVYSDEQLLQHIPLHNAADVPHVNKLLVTTLARGSSLKDYMGTSTAPRITVISILFQLLFSIYAMSMLGFQHNDLHYKNIHVDTKPLNKEGLYFLEGKKYRIPLPVHITIFDFDLGSCLPCGEHASLSNLYCKQFGVCNERNPRFDMYTILSYIKDSTSVIAYPELVEMIHDIMGPEPITQHFDYRMCNEVSETECKAFPPSMPASVMTPAEAIDVYFPNFLEKVPRRRKSQRTK